jgi:hypothetical protein
MDPDNPGLSPDHKGFIVQSAREPSRRMARYLITLLLGLLAATIYLVYRPSAVVQNGNSETPRFNVTVPIPTDLPSQTPGSPKTKGSVNVDLESIEIIVKETVPFPENCPTRIIQGYVDLFSKRAALMKDRQVDSPLDPNDPRKLKHTFPRQAYFIIDGWKLDGNVIESQEEFRKHWRSDDFTRYYTLTYLLPILEKYPDWERLTSYNYYRQRTKTQPVGLATYYADPSAFGEKP